MAMSASSAWSLCCVVDWHIENFSCCLDPKKEGLLSDKFVIDSLYQSSWFLLCYPKGTGNSDPNVQFYLHRSNNVPEREKIHVKFHISLLDHKGTSILTQGRRIKDFEVNRGHGYDSFLRQDRVLKEAEKYFPQDVCRIRCHIFKLAKDPTHVMKVFLKTCVPVKRYFFDWSIDNFSTCTISNKKVHIVEPVNEESILTLSIWYDMPTESVELVNVNFYGNADESRFSWQCKIHTSKTKDEFLMIQKELPILPYEGSVQPLISKDTIIKNAYKYLDANSLMLTCEVSMILHEQMNTVTTNLQSKNQSIPLYDINENDNTPLISPESKTQSSSLLKNDIIHMYHKGIMCDFSVEVKGIQFPVHSLILASRSPVFRTMLETNMKEKQDQVLKLDDMDENVVRRFLNYLYTDNPGDLTVDLALELYSLGQLYEIKGLKVDSASYLKENIEISNIGDIILLSDRYKDEGLKSAAVQFIFRNEEEVLSCKEYKDFATSNAQLSVDIFFKLSDMRLKKREI